MEYGDVVAEVNSLGVIVGIDTADNPIVEMVDVLEGTKYFQSFSPEQLVVVNIEPSDELDPTKEDKQDG